MRYSKVEIFQTYFYVVYSAKEGQFAWQMFVFALDELINLYL